ncbi:hypothetical protein DN752_17350 [Echinicola strongylocentroti]|uniref:Uncharacterized protein n=1 Tax=Echinicola strongylocentroti TaxID=1795355 RepID=A0A2Z4IMZ4_9BACT|nr:hypothetical protein [Echinicola strongylocentroti]AWW31753.1 hypothetical protein DN752_17350 [Echinicola strongylocentroti]
MKHLIFVPLLTLLVSVGFCKNPEDKTFVVIFSKKELKELKSSAEYIELSFIEDYKTKTYTGNSDAVIFINVANCDFDKCHIAQQLVQINNTTWKPLQEVAFRVIDLSESKENFQELLVSFNSQPVDKEEDKKKGKITQSIL